MSGIMPQPPSGGGMMPAASSSPSLMVSMQALRSSVSARRPGVKALLALGPGDTRSSVVAPSACQMWPSTERQKSRKRNWLIITSVLDVNELQL
jgi:hypothetical protein